MYYASSVSYVRRFCSAYIVIASTYLLVTNCLQTPRWSSAVDQELLYVRAQIENAPMLENDNELYSPLYRNVSMFKRYAYKIHRILDPFFPFYVFLLFGTIFFNVNVGTKIFYFDLGDFHILL